MNEAGRKGDSRFHYFQFQNCLSLAITATDVIKQTCVWVDALKGTVDIRGLIDLRCVHKEYPSLPNAIARGLVEPLWSPYLVGHGYTSDQSVLINQETDVALGFTDRIHSSDSVGMTILPPSSEISSSSMEWSSGFRDLGESTHQSKKITMVVWSLPVEKVLTRNAWDCGALLENSIAQGQIWGN